MSGTSYIEEEMATYCGHNSNPTTSKKGHKNNGNKYSNRKKGYSNIPKKENRKNQYTFWDKNDNNGITKYYD